MGCRVGIPEFFRLGKSSLVAHTYLKVKGLLEVTVWSANGSRGRGRKTSGNVCLRGNVGERQLQVHQDSCRHLLGADYLSGATAHPVPCRDGCPTHIVHLRNSPWNSGNQERCWYGRGGFLFQFITEPNPPLSPAFTPTKNQWLVTNCTESEASLCMPEGHEKWR